MWLQKVWDKYVEEPAEKRERVDINARLQYSLTGNPAKHKPFLIAGLAIILVLTVLFLLNIISLKAFIVTGFAAFIILRAAYTYQPGYCKTCGDMMVRQSTEGGDLYYFCDHCKTKFPTGINIREGGTA